ncbi:MAG: hypothetical protein IIT39_13270 [Clostridia bacterium]|nr:hypothetical protein [Clostridia bacterium]
MDKIPMGEIPINEIKNFAEYWQALVKAVEVISTLEMQNEKLVAINQEQFKKIKTLFAEIDKLKKKLDKQEQRIKELSDSERTLQLAEEELYQANKISDEARIQMKQAEHLKSTLEDLINDYYQRSLAFQEQTRKDDGEE